MAEQAENNINHLASMVSLLYANLEYWPRNKWPTDDQFSNSASEIYGKYMDEIQEQLQIRLGEANWSDAKKITITEVNLSNLLNMGIQ